MLCVSFGVAREAVQSATAAAVVVAQ